MNTCTCVWSHLIIAILNRTLIRSFKLRILRRSFRIDNLFMLLILQLCLLLAYKWLLRALVNSLSYFSFFFVLFVRASIDFNLFYQLLGFQWWLLFIPWLYTFLKILFINRLTYFTFFQIIWVSIKHFHSFIKAT